MILKIIGIIAIIWLFFVVIFNIAIYINFRLTQNSKHVCITRNTYFSVNEYGIWYIIPTIGVTFEFDDYNRPSIEIDWLKYTFTMDYHIKSEIEEEAEAKAWRELSKKNNES